MATRDTTDGIGHRYYGEAESNGRSYNRCCICSTTQTDGCTATEECQYKCTDTFSNVLFHVLLVCEFDGLLSIFSIILFKGELAPFAFRRGGRGGIVILFLS